MWWFELLHGLCFALSPLCCLLVQHISPEASQENLECNTDDTFSERSAFSAYVLLRMCVNIHEEMLLNSSPTVISVSNKQGLIK